MFMYKSIIGNLLKWLLRIITLPIVLYLVYLIFFEKLTVRVFIETVILIGAFVLIILSPNQPWRNKPLLYFLLFVNAMLIVASWWFVTVYATMYVVKSLFGEDVASISWVGSLSIVLCLSLQYTLSYYLSPLVSENRIVVTYRNRFRELVKRKIQ